jgi:hypothetical protein
MQAATTTGGKNLTEEEKQQVIYQRLVQMVSHLHGQSNVGIR